jgi:hypothetical protein
MRYSGDFESIEGLRAKIQEVVEQAAGAASATTMSERGERKRARHNRAAASYKDLSARRGFSCRLGRVRRRYAALPRLACTCLHHVDGEPMSTLSLPPRPPSSSVAPPASSPSPPSPSARSPPRPPRSRPPARPRHARAYRHGPRARSRRPPPRVTRPHLSRVPPRRPPRRHPSRSRTPSPSRSSSTRRRRSSTRGTGTRPTLYTRYSRTPRSSRRSGAHASPSSFATVSRTSPVTRVRSSARRGCVGLYGFDVRGPAAFPKMQVHYWKNVLEILRNTVGAEVFVTSVPPCVSSSPSTSPALMPCEQDGVHR